MKRTLIALALAGISATTVYAQQNTVRIGFVSVAPNSSASAISGPLTPTNALSLKVENQNTVFFSASRALNDNWDIELAAGFPPTHDVSIVILDPSLPASIQAYNGKTAAKIRQVAPALFANYKFGTKESTFRPFLGIGANYTIFDKRESAPDGDAINGGPTKIALKDSFGLAFQAGVTYRINDQWSITGAYTTAQVKTELTTNTLGVVRKADIKFRPTVLSISAGYSF
jgi:outer membrane protein